MTDAARDHLLADFYSRHLVPAAQALRARGADVFPVGPEENSESHYLERDGTSDYVLAYDGDRFGSDLAQRWSTGGFPELLELVEPLVALAQQLEDVRAPGDDDVSPFIYAMF